MIELRDDQLHFHFPEIHPEARCSIEFQRTLRLPDDNHTYPLPPGLGCFPLMHVDDLGERLPSAWEQHGGVFFPMYQAEAMWISYESEYPFALKIAAGKINAVTGGAWTNKLQVDPQDYVVVPDQPWLDGFCVDKGKIRQFVAMPLGEGYTAEEQLTGKAELGGLQIIAYPMKREAYQRYIANRKYYLESDEISSYELDAKYEPDMGLAPGGLMHQEIYEDDYGIDAWETEVFSRCYVHLANSQVYEKLTGHPPPTKPPTAKTYIDAGLPWFEYYDEKSTALPGSQSLAGLDSVAAKGIKKGKNPLPENEHIAPAHIKKLGPAMVREGKF